MQEDESYLNKRGLTHFWENIDALKQDKLTAGANISIASDNTISASQPTVNNATLTIQKEGTSVGTFTANASTNSTVNIIETDPTVPAWAKASSKPSYSWTEITNRPTIPTKTSDLTNDSGFLTNTDYASASTGGVIKVGAGLAISSGGVLSATGGGTADAVAWGHITGTMADQTDLTNALAAKADSSSLAAVATSGSYNDLTNKPTIGNATLTIQKNGTSAGTFTANATSNQTINITVPTTAADVSALPASTKYGASIAVSINTTDYKVTTTLKDQDGNTLGTAQVIDLPLESVVVNGSYDSTNKKIVLTLQSGSTIDIPVADLVAGLQSEITAQNMLSSDLVDDTNHTHKFVTAAQITKLNGIATGAEVNQNAFSNVKVGSTTVAADSKTDTLELVAGSNVTLTPDATNDKVTIAATDTTYSDATTSASGLMSASDKTKLNGIASGAEVNVQSDWTQTTTTADDYIKNKPNLATVATSGAYSDLSGTPSLATVATSGSYNDLSNKPTIPTVNNATLTIQKNGTNVQTFTANQSTNATANITVPTKVSDLTNDSGYTTNTGTITQVKLDGANVATSGVANVQAIPTTIGSSSVGGDAGDITSLKKYGSVNYNGSIIGTNILNLSVNRFYHCYERGATITCNYFSNPNDFCNGAYSRWDSTVNPSTAFTTTPFVLEIKKTSSFEMTDVSRLLLIGHRLYGELMATKYKIEVAYAYSNSTYSWGTIIDYDGAAVDICQKFYGLYYSNHGTSANSWHSIFGIRLTISGSTSTIFKLADVQLICGRGTEQPYESIHALSDAGGTVYGNVNITGSLKHGNYTYTLPNKNGTVAMTSDIPSVPTVNNGQLTIQKNGTNVATFTANQSGNATANITVPTATSDLTNDSGFLTSVPTASASTLGGIKVGNNLTISSDGTLSANASSITVDSALSSTSTNPVQNKVINTALNGKQASLSTAQLNAANSGITAAKVTTYDGYASQIAGKQDTLTAGDHIDITGDTIKAVDYVHSENPQAAAAASSTITGSMMASGTITADKLAPGATVQLTLSSSDIGEGAPLAANTLYGVYL